MFLPPCPFSNPCPPSLSSRPPPSPTLYHSHLLLCLWFGRAACACSRPTTISCTRSLPATADWRCTIWPTNSTSANTYGSTAHAQAHARTHAHTYVHTRIAWLQARDHLPLQAYLWSLLQVIRYERGPTCRCTPPCGTESAAGSRALRASTERPSNTPTVPRYNSRAVSPAQPLACPALNRLYNISHPYPPAGMLIVWSLSSARTNVYVCVAATTVRQLWQALVTSDVATVRKLQSAFITAGACNRLMV